MSLKCDSFNETYLLFSSAKTFLLGCEKSKTEETEVQPSSSVNRGLTLYQ